MPIDFSPYYTPAIDSEAALKSLYHRDGRVTAPRVQLLNRDLSPIELIEPPNPSDRSDIGPFVTSLTVTNNAEQDVHRSCNLTISEQLDKQFQYNTLQHRVKVWVDDYASVEDRKNGVAPLVSVPVGVFMGLLPSRDLASSGNTWKITLHGLTQFIASLYFTNEFTVPSNYLFIDAMKNIAMADGLPPDRGGRTSGGGAWPFGTHPGLAPNGCNSPGPNWPESRIKFPPFATRTPADRSFTNKDNQLAALKTMSTSANLFTPWDDENGNLLTGQLPYYSNSVPDSVWELKTDADSVIAAPIGQDWGGLDKIGNCVVVESQNNNSDIDPIHVEMYNESESSLISTRNLGYTITMPPIQDDHIPDLWSAQFRALVELQRAATLYEQITLNHAINPWIFNGVPDKMLKLNVNTRGGQPEITSDPYPFEIVSSSITITKGNRMQSTTLRRVVYV